jgi:hypothetical protein
MQPGQFLVNSLSQKNKILGICDEVICISYASDYESILGWYTKKELKQLGYSLLEEPWVPRRGDLYYVVIHIGKEKESIKQNYWYEDKTDEFRLSMGNVHRTREDAELYKQKLIERMGKK